MSVEYRHTQTGFLTAGATGAGMLVAAKSLLKGGPAVVAALPAVALLGSAAVVFSSLTIEIRNGHLRSYFGLGLPAKSADVRDIRSVRVVRNPWYAGWGIRFTPRGTLYNVSGFDAVEVELKDGKRFRLGTDEPDALHRALETAMEEEARAQST